MVTHSSAPGNRTQLSADVGPSACARAGAATKRSPTSAKTCVDGTAWPVADAREGANLGCLAIGAG